LTGFLPAGAAFCADTDEAACGLRPAKGRHRTINSAPKKKSKDDFNITPSSADVSEKRHLFAE
jgi:hypothetical protein